MVYERAYMIILIMSYMYQNATSLKEKYKDDNCKVYNNSDGNSCKECIKNYKLTNNKCQYMSNSYIRTIFSDDKIIPNDLRNTNHNICNLENCISCYNTNICSQCKDLNYFINPSGKCTHFCEHMNCKKCQISSINGSWLCHECLEGYIMDSKTSNIILYHRWLLCRNKL